MPYVGSDDNIFKETEVEFDLMLSNIDADRSGILQLVSKHLPSVYPFCSPPVCLWGQQVTSKRPCIVANQKQYYPL